MVCYQSILRSVEIIFFLTATSALEGETAPSLASEFDRDGFVVVKGFASDSQCAEMMQQMGRIIDSWDPEADKVSVFRTDKAQESAQGSDDYFLSSADKIHFFLEPGATAEQGDSEGDTIKKEFTKHLALNKVGHGLHALDPVFKAYTQSPKVGAVVRSLGWSEHAVVPQSMFIFKQPGVGSEVPPHQDSTFLFTIPKQTCLGLWLALEDATEENGMLWARPGSHTEAVRKQFARNPRYFKEGNFSEPMMVFVDQSHPLPHPSLPSADDENADDEEGDEEGEVDDASIGGPSKEGLLASAEREGRRQRRQHQQRVEAIRALGFVPLPVRKGDLVALHGQVDHMSLANTSPKSRHTFQLHVIEGPGAGVEWSPLNWLQYGRGADEGAAAGGAPPPYVPGEGFPTLHVPGRARVGSEL
mmetsp:Transcript_2328/g.4163  ORF Transcript_2328/g.4163 Transcript_2328/m.4163 type:complete len:416 (+) Transcript_2328:37-1284(+)